MAPRSLAHDKFLPYEKKMYFAQSLTGLQYCNQPMDLWIEITMNLDSKLKQGWLQLLQNDTQLFCTTRNVNNVTRIKTALENSLNCQRRRQKHVECQPARRKKDEQAVQDLILCMDYFDADPFVENIPELPRFNLVLLRHLKYAFEEGEKPSNDFLEKQVFS